MADVVLLYDPDCPNVSACRSKLREAFAAVGQTPCWREVDRTAKDTPCKYKGFGSPTILVDGHDLGNEKPTNEGASCRLYRNEEGAYERTPSVASIARILRETRPPAPNTKPTNGTRWGKSLAAFPAVGAALFPTLTCPACWPGYAAILSSLGIGFLPSNRVLLPLTFLFLTFYLGMLAWDAQKCRRVGPLILGVVASVVLICGRFVIASDAALYAGIGLLMTASAWNVWSGKQRMLRWVRCPACEVASETQPTAL